MPRTKAATLLSVLIAIRLTRREVSRQRSPRARVMEGIEVLGRDVRHQGHRVSTGHRVRGDVCPLRNSAPPDRAAQDDIAAGRGGDCPGEGAPGFSCRRGFLLHRGHTWALPEGSGVFKIGMDDFAGRLIGEPTALMLPSPGRKLDQGERGWQVRVNGDILDVLSPVRGEVLEINEQVINSPSVVAARPLWARLVNEGTRSAAQGRLGEPALRSSSPRVVRRSRRRREEPHARSSGNGIAGRRNSCQWVCPRTRRRSLV